jgi:hypothetical protein
MISATTKSELTLMQRVALTRLRRFARVAEVAEQSDSPIWQELARRSAVNAYRDALLLGLSSQAAEIAGEAPERSEAA